MTQLSLAKNPNILGKKKLTKYGELHFINLSDSYRLSYNVDFKAHEIINNRVGSHIHVYGKD